MNKAREWYIAERKDADYDEAYALDAINPSSCPIHVIEYSAYEDLKYSMKSWEVAREIEIYANSDKQWNELIAERDRYKAALEYYANHPSVISEAYHSNDDKQITCVHTFINHVAIEALDKYRPDETKIESK